MRLFPAVLAMAVLFVIGCGSRSDTGVAERRVDIGVAHKTLQAQLPPHMDMTCQQMTMVLPVDPNVAAQYLTPGRDLALTNDVSPRAQLFVPIKNCEHFSAGDTEYGPLSFFTVWLVVQGPFVITPVDDTASTLPTFYVQPLGTFFDSKEFWQDMKKIGVDINRPKHIALGDFGTPGYVYEHGDVGFSWQEWLGPPSPDSLGMNIVEYRDSDAVPVVESIQCVMQKPAYGYTVLSINPESILAPFGVQPGLTLDGNVHCSANFTAQ